MIKNLTEELNILLADEDLTDDKLRDASESLLPTLADYLNGCGHIADGVALILKERREQVEKHNRTIQQDVDYNSGVEKPLTKAAGALSIEHITPLFIRMMKPEGWDETIWNKMMSKPYKERLIIAGAFIAAEIDRLKAISEAIESNINSAE